MSPITRRSRAAVTVLASSFVLLAAAAAEARVLASGFLMSSNAVRLGCRVLNVGATSATITAAKVVSEGGVDLTDFQSCAGALAPGKSCSFTAPGPGYPLAGIVKVAGPTKNLRGVCVLYTSAINAVASTEMR